MPHMPVLSYETIADDLIVCTSQLHRFGTDAVLLTEFSEYRQKDRVCDLGTGCGIIPILMQRTAPPREIYAVDIQPEAIAQMCQGIAESMGIGSVLHPVCTDLKELWDCGLPSSAGTAWASSSPCAWPVSTNRKWPGTSWTPVPPTWPNWRPAPPARPA